jgi:hypothetical protein
MSEQARATVRMQRALKHYKNNLLTQAGNPDVDTVDNLLCDLHHYCRKHGIDLVERMNEAERATNMDTATCA